MLNATSGETPDHQKARENFHRRVILRRCRVISPPGITWIVVSSRWFRLQSRRQRSGSHAPTGIVDSTSAPCQPVKGVLRVRLNCFPQGILCRSRLVPPSGTSRIERNHYDQQKQGSHGGERDAKQVMTVGYSISVFVSMGTHDDG